MRLLDTQTLEPCEILGWSTVPYAILSHTWGDEEVSFQEIQKPESRVLQGYRKIERCCTQALKDGYSYVWIDTCCIDKTSSAELQEAINSMFDWYAKASVCYVHLSDFTFDDSTSNNPDFDRLAKCRWFGRGFTLQELLAPWRVQFHDQDWRYIGSKQDMLPFLSRTTGIEEDYLSGKVSVRKASVACRMSWAAYRVTTRLEDEAYCLMGLFDVNMPLLYGEGTKAFLRLQHEITRISEDESLFAWFSDPSLSQCGIFARRPHDFAGEGNIQPFGVLRFRRPPYVVTSRGLSVTAVYQTLRLQDTLQYRHLAYRPDAYILFPLNCSRKGSYHLPISLILKAVGDSIYVRWLPHETEAYTKWFSPREGFKQELIYIRKPQEGEVLFR
ncbi:MAG: hypothetical protein Q9222_002999 [Ikaeria aurantiellina]